MFARFFLSFFRPIFTCPVFLALYFKSAFSGLSFSACLFSGNFCFFRGSHYCHFNFSIALSPQRVFPSPILFTIFNLFIYLFEVISGLHFIRCQFFCLTHSFVYSHLIRLFQPHFSVISSFQLSAFLFPSPWKLIILVPFSTRPSYFLWPFIFSPPLHIFPALLIFVVRNTIFRFSKEVLFSFASDLIFFFAQENWINKGQQRQQWMFRRSRPPKHETGVSNKSSQLLNLKCVLDI